MNDPKQGAKTAKHISRSQQKQSAPAQAPDKVELNKVSIYPNITVTKQGKEAPILHVLEDIRKGTYKDIVNKVRALEYGSKPYKAMKKQAPYFTASGTFEPRNDEGLKVHSGLIAIDIDNQGEVNELKALVCCDPFVVSAFTSIGGKGLCILVKIDPDRHKESFAALKAYYLSRYDLEADKTQDISRPRFVSYDPDIYINPDASIFDVDQVKVKEATPAEVEQVSHTWTDQEQIDFAERLTKKHHTYQVGNRHNYILQLASFCIRLGVPQSALEAHIGYSYPDFAKSPTNAVKWAYKNWQGNFATWKNEKRNFSPNGRTTDPKAPEKKKPTKTAKKANSAKEWMKKNRIRIRFNSITQLYELNGKDLTDRQVNTLYLSINNAGIQAGKELVRALIESDETPEYNPLIEFFKANKRMKPQGKIKALAASVVQDTFSPEFWEMLLTKWMVGAVAALEPGKRNILELVLQGTQDTGKSYFFEALLPNELTDYFAYSRLDGDKDADILICQKFLVLDDEYGGKSKLDAKRHKELISKRSVTVRLPYGRHPITMQRIATFAGTTNDENILADPTGNRRVIPVKVLSRDFNAYDAIDKKELWLEAYHLAKSGFDYQLTKEEVSQLNENTGHFQTATAEAENLFAHIGKPDDHEGMEESYLTTTEIRDYLERVSNSRHRLSMKALGMELNSQGFNKTTKRIRGNPAKVWHVIKLTPESLPPRGL